VTPNPFFDRPILNSPYECPRRHWELDEAGQPTQRIIESRRRAEFITPIPKPKKHKKAAAGDVRLRRRQRALHQGAGVRPYLDHQRGAPTRRRVPIGGTKGVLPFVRTIRASGASTSPPPFRNEKRLAQGLVGAVSRPRPG
jgi:hypothetical protein